MSLLPLARYREGKSAIKLQAMIGLRGSIHEFVTITEGKVHEVNALDWMAFEAAAFYVMDPGHVDFNRLARVHRAQASFVKNNFEIDVLVVAKIYKARGSHR